MKRLVAVLVLAARAASAQEATFEALGQAQVVGGDRVRARDRALEEAIKQAVEQAVSTVLEPDALVARSSDLRLRIYPKARNYLANYRILDEGDQGSAFQVHISATVATGRLAHDLASVPQPAAPPGKPGPRPRAVVCLRGADSVVVRELVSGRGVELATAPSTCSDEAAAAAARTAAAQAAVVGEAESSPAGTIRGTDQLGAHARAHVRLVDPDGRVSAEGSAERDAYGAALDRAEAAAAREAIAEAARALLPALAARWPAPAPSGGVLVRLNGVTRYGEYLALARALAGVAGVSGVEPRRFAVGEIELLVRTATPAGQLGSGLLRLPPPGLRLSVTPAGDGLTVDVASDSAVPERG
jgi:hypothetical protein